MNKKNQFKVIDLTVYLAGSKQVEKKTTDKNKDNFVNKKISLEKTIDCKS